MDTLKRAFKYVIRKRGKTLILFMLFLTIGILVLSGISIKRAGDISQDSLRKTM
jgi:putative ABC transport system permease protein